MARILMKFWRPLMAWQYLLVCFFDFLIAPIMFAYYQSQIEGIPLEKLAQWQPITLQGGGLYHLAMGAIVGVYAFSRTNEKLQMMKSKYYGDEFVKTEIESLGNKVDTQ